MTRCPRIQFLTFKPPKASGKQRASLSSLTCELSCRNEAGCLHVGLELFLDKKKSGKTQQPRAVG